ncbi:MAG: CHAT domain-containing protein [Myxococcales bacterium]|nr:CHAT domain-containing protein [Myxococcales bacterium]
MASAQPGGRKPLILLTFANEAATSAAWLRALPAEVRALREALQPAQDAGLCHVEVETNASVDTLIEALQRPREDTLAVFHYAGHASGDGLFLEGEGGAAQQAHAGGLARLLSRQPGLQVVFLNGCSTEPQVRRLLDLGVPAVIATNRAIDDGVATRFAQTFYRRLAQGAAVGEAFADAENAILVTFGEGGSLFRTEVTRSFAPIARAEEATGDLPWRLHTASGAEPVEAWSLPAAAGDPLFGLPPLPDLDLPPAPFLHLNRYERAHCAIFFGRGAKIRELWDALTADGRPPLTVLHGPSGAGKSSLLEAGLLPRLEADHDVVVLRRDLSVGLPAMISEALGGAGVADLAAAWHAREAAAGRPLVLILDQIEEIITRPLSAAEDELGQVVAQLSAVFARRADRPRGRVLLTLRAEWLAALLGRLEEARLPLARVELRHLAADAVEEVVLGPASVPQLTDFYGLSVEPELPALIAADLTLDADAAVAPTLAVLLHRLWEAARSADGTAPVLRVATYQEHRRDGLLLDDFLDRQLRALRARELDWVDSGLALDILAYHTSKFGSSLVRGAEELRERYAHLPEVWQLLIELKEHHLLAGTLRRDGGSLVGEARLAHDTLGPLIRARFEASNLPGQRARRVIRQRVVEWADGQTGNVLGRYDLSLVEAGRVGMADLRADAVRLVEASQQDAREQRRNRLVSRAATLALLLIVMAAAMLTVRSNRAVRLGQHQSAITLRALHFKEAAMPVETALRSLEDVASTAGLNPGAMKAGRGHAQKVEARIAKGIDAPGTVGDADEFFAELAALLVAFEQSVDQLEDERRAAIAAQVRPVARRVDALRSRVSALRACRPDSLSDRIVSLFYAEDGTPDTRLRWLEQAVQLMKPIDDPRMTSAAAAGTIETLLDLVEPMVPRLEGELVDATKPACAQLGASTPDASSRKRRAFGHACLDDAQCDAPRRCLPRAADDDAGEPRVCRRASDLPMLRRALDPTRVAAAVVSDEPTEAGVAAWRAATQLGAGLFGPRLARLGELVEDEDVASAVAILEEVWALGCAPCWAGLDALGEGSGLPARFLEDERTQVVLALPKTLATWLANPSGVNPACAPPALDRPTGHSLLERIVDLEVVPGPESVQTRFKVLPTTPQRLALPRQLPGSPPAACQWTATWSVTGKTWVKVRSDVQPVDTRRDREAWLEEGSTRIRKAETEREPDDRGAAGRDAIRNAAAALRAYDAILARTPNDLETLGKKAYAYLIGRDLAAARHLLLEILQAPQPLTTTAEDLERVWREQTTNLDHLAEVARLSNAPDEARALDALRCHQLAWGASLGFKSEVGAWQPCAPKQK